MSTRRGRPAQQTGPGSITTAKRTCSIEGCDAIHSARGWCSMHYQRWWHHNDPMGGLWWLAREQKHRKIVAEMRQALAALNEAVAR